MSNIALCLYGIHTKWYKKNSIYKSATIFTFQWDKDIIDINNRYIEIKNPLPIFDGVHQSQRKFEMIKYSIDKLLEKVREFEIIQQSKFDKIIFMSFSHILLDNITDNELYQVKHFNYSNVEYKYNIIRSIEIVSDNFVRVDGGPITNIYNLLDNIRIHLFQLLFDNKIISVVNNNIILNSDKLFVIPSVINVSSNSFDYVSYRSIFSPRERFNQTYDQCISLKNKGDIIICEGSKLNLWELEQLTKHAYICLFFLDSMGFYYANVCKNKSMFEIYAMQYILQHTKSNYLFKFGGRYKLLKDFDISVFIDPDNCCMKIINGSDTYSQKSIVECIIYSIPSKYHKYYINAFGSMLLKEEGSIENLLYDTLQDVTFKKISVLNIIGQDAIEGFQNFC